MLLRSLLAGLRAVSAGGLCPSISRAAQGSVPALGAAAAAQGSVATAAAAATAMPRSLATACSSFSSSACSSLPFARSSGKLGSVVSSLAGGTSCAAAAAGRGSGNPCSGLHQLLQQRSRTTSGHLKVKYAGGKMKSYSSYKSRFRVTGGGKVLYARPGHVHKRFGKSKRQLFDLSGTQALTPRYAKTVKKLGFKMRTW